MADWGEFAKAAPVLSEAGRALLYRGGSGSGLLATVREGQPPRIHPVTVGIVDRGLYTFVLPSAKRGDLRRDGRYALHSHLDPAAPDEFMIRGRAQVVGEPTRSSVADGWKFEVDETYELYELLIESAVLGERPTADDWPPRYTSWVG
jgi:hypothetical protein